MVYFTLSSQLQNIHINTKRKFNFHFTFYKQFYKSIPRQIKWNNVHHYKIDEIEFKSLNLIIF